jgi:6-phosphogluconolactonase (cycloisomerase 2 family)
MDRRQFNGVLGIAAGMMAVPLAARAAAPKRAMFYAGIGAALYGFAVDPAKRVLVQRYGPYPTPKTVQAAWQNPRTGHLYVATSDGNTSTDHALLAFAVGADGSLRQVGAPVTLAARPIHLTVDSKGRYVAIAYPIAKTLSIHRIAADGSLGDAVVQTARLEAGNYLHQVRFLPDDRTVLVMARGTTPTATAPEQLGSIRLFPFRDGQLSQGQILAPNGGKAFRARNSEFAPSGRFVYSALEAQNQINTYGLAGGRMSEAPLFTATSLARPAEVKPGQMLSASRLHPNGRFLYVANRGTGLEDFQGEKVYVGEDSVAVFAIDGRTGEPRLIQSIPIPALQVRGMDLTPDGLWLVAAGMVPGKVRSGGGVETVPEGLSLFSVGQDGRLTFASRLLAPTQTEATIWTGAVLY